MHACLHLHDLDSFPIDDQDHALDTTIMSRFIIFPNFLWKLLKNLYDKFLLAIAEQEP